MAQTPPIVKDGILTYLRDGKPAQIVLDSSNWFAWLETASSFTFHSEQSHFTARKERAGHRRGKLYWRAYHTLDGKLHRVYLGQSETLTLHHLQAIAARLCGTHVGETPGDRKGQYPSNNENDSWDMHPSKTDARPGRDPRVGVGGAADAVGGPCADPDSPSTPYSQGTLPTAPAFGPEKRVQPWHSTLPMPLTPLFGREHEISALATLLRHTSVRLVTLTGTGGVGKTRLALSGAKAVADTFADGICFVPLAPISDPEQVMPAIAKALGLWEALDHPHADHVRDFLRAKHLLLLLDNFEQVAPASPQIAALAISCPHLHVLMTSRVALHLSGEYELPVSPLPTPDLTHLPELRNLAQVAAVRLFVERARAILSPFDSLRPTPTRSLLSACIWRACRSLSNWLRHVSSSYHPRPCLPASPVGSRS